METPKTYKRRILDYLETVGPEGADNAQIRAATGIPSHQQVYLLTQELAARREIVARRKGRMWVFFPLDAPAPASFEGLWRIVSSPDFENDYLEVETFPFIHVRKGKQLVFSGDFHFGLVQGDIVGRLDGKQLLFSFEAMDELDPVHGAGTLALQERRMELRLLFQYGDHYTFYCVRHEEMEGRT